MSNVSPLALLDSAALADPVTAESVLPRLRAVPAPLPPAALASPGLAGIYRLPDVAPDASLVGYLVLVPVGTELDVTAVPARVRQSEADLLHQLSASGPAPVQAGPAPVQAGPHPVQSPGATRIELDRERRTARVDGEPLELTYLEFELLAHLTGNPHRVHTRDHLVSVVWGYGHVGDGRTVDVHVARLRRKLGRHRDSIVTVRRVGYKYVPVSAG